MVTSFELYQEGAESTAGNTELAVLALGLGGETGEVLDIIKKVMGHSQALNVDKIGEELGDVLWYVAMLCTHLNLDMGEVAHNNLRKLQKRHPAGFDPSYHDAPKGMAAVDEYLSRGSGYHPPGIE